MRSLSKATPAVIGGKARQLVELQLAGFRVPDFLCSPPDIATAIEILGLPLAVRSSASAEDGREVSFAGRIFRFDSESLGRGKDGLYTFFAEFLEIDECRASVGGVFFTAHDRQLVCVDQSVSDLVQKDEPDGTEHFLVRFVVLPSIAFERLKEILH